MNRIGLIGYPLGHSRSPEIFSKIFQKEGSSNWSYDLFEIPPGKNIRSWLNKIQHLKGFNVTIPYKETIIPSLDEISEEARSIGAVNTVVVSHGKWHGHNTDYFGFRNSLSEWKLSPEKVLILGTGGASKAVQKVFQDLDIPCLTVSRKTGNADLTYDDLDTNVISSVDTIINTTPLGTYPHIKTSPEIPYEILDDQVMIDLVYNPDLTEFMKKGLAQGCRVFNGGRMLQLQAEKAWELFKA